MVRNWSTEQGCSACGKSTENGSVLHHLMTRKAYPEHQLKTWNLFPCCVSCHSQFHLKGTAYMALAYTSAKDWLISNGWEYDETYNKWRHNN